MVGRLPATPIPLGDGAARGKRKVAACARSLSIGLTGWKLLMAPQVHPVVQDATDLNDLPLNDPVNQEVTSAAAVPGSMERADARHDVFACL